MSLTLHSFSLLLCSCAGQQPCWLAIMGAVVEQEKETDCKFELNLRNVKIFKSYALEDTGALAYVEGRVCAFKHMQRDRTAP